LEPYSDGCEFDEAHEVGEQLVVSGCHPSELLEFGKEALDAIALLVKFAVVGPLCLSISLGRDNDIGSSLFDPVAQMISVIALVSEDGLRFEAVDEVVCQSDVIALSR
jgi:hypothetical protein